jgi:hypothetical protein
MSDEAAVFEPTVNHNFVGDIYYKFVNHRPGANGP